jgi:adenosylcobinamide-GDP ribazoletransferase
VKKEVTIFLSALMFLTRLPVPKNMDHNELYLQKAPKYFPLIGCLVALLSAVVFLVVHKFISPDIAILAMMITGILITGCFHEDGFADSCDAFGGGWTKEKILAIMKDSRLGTYGVAGLGLMLAAKFLLLKEIAAWLSLAVQSEVQFYLYFLAVSMAAHSSSRLMSVLVIQLSNYVTSADGSKSKPLAAKKLNLPELVTVCIFALLPFVLLPLKLLLVVFPMLLITWLGLRYFTKWIGGYTGDCLGAIQQVTEIIFYLSTFLIWKYIL